MIQMIVTLVLLVQAAFGQLGSSKMMELALDVKAVTENGLEYSYHVTGFPVGHPKKLYFGVEKRGVHMDASKLVSGESLCQKNSLIHGDGTKTVKLPCTIESAHDYTLWAAVDEDSMGKGAHMFGNRDFSLGASVTHTSMEMHVRQGSVHGFTLDYTMTGHTPGGRLYVAVSKEMSGYTAVKIADENDPNTVCWAEIVQKEGTGQHKFSCSLEPGSRYMLYTATASNAAGENTQEFQSTEFGIESITQTIMVTQKNLNREGFDFTYQMQNVVEGGRLYIAVTREGDTATPNEVASGGGSIVCNKEYHQVNEKEHTGRVDCPLESNTHYTLWIAAAIDSQQGGLKMLAHEPFFVPEGGTSGKLQVKNVKESGFDLIYKLDNHIPGGLIYFAVTEEGVRLTPQQISKDEEPVKCYTAMAQGEREHTVPWACPLQRTKTYTLWMAVASDGQNSFLKSVTHLNFKIKQLITTRVEKNFENVNSNGFDLNYKLSGTMEGGEVCFSVSPATNMMDSDEVSKGYKSPKAYCHMCVPQVTDGQEHKKKMKCKKKLEIAHTYMVYSAVSDSERTDWQLAGNKALTIKKIIQVVTTRVTDVSMKGFTLNYKMSGSNKGGKIYWMLAETCPAEPLDMIRMVKEGTDHPSGVLHQEDNEEHSLKVKGKLDPNRNYKVCIVLDPDGSETQTTTVESQEFGPTKEPTKEPTHKPTKRSCVDNMNFNKQTGHEPCTPCKDCGGESLTEFECTRTSDRICRRTCSEGMDWSRTGDEPCTPCKHCGRYQATTYWCSTMKDSECEDLCPLAPDCSCNMGFNARMRKSGLTGCAECTCEEDAQTPLPPPVNPPVTPAGPEPTGPEPGTGSTGGSSTGGSTSTGGSSTGGSSTGGATEGEGEGAATEGGSTGGAATEGEGEAGSSNGCGEDDDDDDDDDDCGEDGRLSTRSSRLSMFGRGGQAKWIWVYVLAGVATLLTGALIVKYVRNRRKYNGDHMALDHLLAHDTQL